ncbi:MAG TPA: PAS domain S-box protein [Rhizomicrobium sp.]|nr:PAS domain S-box protein [Rhizomicrobium sp.]
MRGPQLSIRDILLLITGTLTLIVALLAAREVYGNWQRLRDIRALTSASILSDQLFDATEKLSVERDIALSILQAPDEQTAADLRPKLEESRRDTDEALRAGLSALNRYNFPELSALRGRIKQQLSGVHTLRSEVDTAAKLPAGDKKRRVASRWSDAVTSLIVETQSLWIGFVGHFINIDPIVTQHLWIKHFLRTITDYSGRERSLIGQLIVENTDPSPRQISQLLRGRGVVEESWQMARILAEQSGLYPSIAPFYTDARSHYSTMHDMIRDMFYVPGNRHGSTYPIGADLWFELSMQASDSLSALRIASIKQTQKYTQSLIDATRWEIEVQAAILIFALLLCGLSFRIIVRRVIQPINSMVEALLRATRGEQVNFVPARDRNDEIGKLSQVLHAFQETLVRIKKTAADLDRSESHLRAVVDHMLDGLIIIDETGSIRSFNIACERIFGYSAADAIGRNLKFLMPESYHPEYDHRIAKYLAGGDEANSGLSGVEAKGQRKDGSVFPMDIAINAFSSPDGRHFSAIIRDITARKKAEEEVARYTSELERSNKELDDFAYIASHDLKEPLRGIHNHSRFLLEDNEDTLDEESTGRLNRLIFLSQRMEKLVNDLLYFSRLGRQELAVQPTDVGAVIADVAFTLDMFLEERNARISLADNLPTVVCDKPRVTELFRNLITNAVKYNDKPEPEVEVGFLETKKKPNGVAMKRVFFVKDNGVGISPEFHHEIFRIFRRLHAGKGPEEGTGVGLTFVKKIVERHGGEIWLESELGKGTTFYFTLEDFGHGEQSRAAA